MKRQIIVKRMVTYTAFWFLLLVAIVFTGNKNTDAATYTTGMIQGSSKLTNYNCRTKIGKYYFWEKYEGTEDGDLYYATSKNGKATCICKSKGGIGSNVTVSGNNVWYMKVANGDNLVYKYNIQTKKNTKVVNLPNFTTFDGIYGTKLYCYNGDKRTEYIYNTTTKKYTTILKNSEYFSSEGSGHYLVLGCAYPDEACSLYVIDMSTGKVKTLTKYCYNGKEKRGYRVINGNVFYRFFLKKGENYKNADSGICKYNFSTGKETLLAAIPKNGICDDVVFVNEKMLYFHFLAKEVKGYFSLNYESEEVKLISKKTFDK